MQIDLPTAPARRESPRGVQQVNQAQARVTEPISARSPSSNFDAQPAALPFSALEHLFVFTTGGKKSVWESPVAVQKFREWVGQDLATVRQNVSRDVVYRCDPTTLLGSEGTLSESAWQVMAARQPALVDKQRKGGSQLRVRTFCVESGTVVALALFYDANKLPA